MGGPGFLSDIFAAVMLTVALYCAGRLIAARRWRRPTEFDTDAAHIVMGVAMAGMLVAGLRTLPTGLWEGVFGAGAAWFGAQLLRAPRAATGGWRCLHPAPHLIECAAMLYVFLILPTTTRRTAAGMGAMATSAAGSRFSFLALAMALFLFGYVVWLGDRVTARAPAAGAPPAPAAGAAPAARRYLAPRCAALCKMAMGITMGYMLILML